MYLDSVVQAAKAGDSEAWEQVYSRFHPALTRYAASRGVPDPEDVAQEVIFCAVRQIDELEGGWDHLRAWLFTVAYRRCADHHRRRYRRPETLTEAVPEGPSAEAGADDGLWAGAEAEEAMEALSILSPRERDVVTMRVLDESSTESVAERLGMSRVNVRVTQSRALAKLRAHLENNGGHLDKRFRIFLLPGLALRLVRRLRNVGDGTGPGTVTGSQSLQALGGTGASAAAPMLAGGANTLVAAFVAVSSAAGTMPAPAAPSPASEAIPVPRQVAVVDRAEIDQPPSTRPVHRPDGGDVSPSVEGDDVVPATTPERPITTRQVDPGNPDAAEDGADEGDAPSDPPEQPGSDPAAPAAPGAGEGGAHAEPTPEDDGEEATTGTDEADGSTDVVDTAVGAVADTTEQALDDVDSLVEDVDSLVDDTVSGVTDVVEDVPIEPVSELAEQAEAAVEGTVDAVTDTTDALTDTAAEATQAATDTVSEATESVEETAEETLDSVEDTVEEAIDSVGELVDGLGGSLFGG